MQKSEFNVELDKDDYDKLEREVTKMQDQLEILKVSVEGERKLTAEVQSGVAMLVAKLGLQSQGDLLKDVELCMQQATKVRQTKKRDVRESPIS